MRAYGFAGGVLVQRSTGFIISGNHSYRTAKAQGATTIPGFWVDVDDDTALAMMMDWNHTNRLGREDPYKAGELLVELLGRERLPASYTRDDVDDILAGLDDHPPDDFPGYDDDIETKYECPACHYRWSGKRTTEPGSDR